MIHEAIKPLALAVALTMCAMELGSCHRASEQGQRDDADDDDDGAGDSDVDVDGDADGPPPAFHMPPNLATGGWHSCALDFFGGAKCWGSNLFGQIGNGVSGPGVYELDPADVVGVDEPIEVIIGGNDFTCAILSGGGAKCWGRSAYGELGYASYDDSAVPVHVVGLDTGVEVIAAGHEHACAVLDTGAVKCWGSNKGGRLGNGESGDEYPDIHYTPQDVSGLDAGAASIACAYDRCCALMEDRTVKCWGRDLVEGVINDSEIAVDLVPTDLPELGDDNEAVVTGTMHTCVLKSGGTVECLGFNSIGQLGDGTTIDSGTPVQVVELEPGVAGLVAGGYLNCALLFGGGVKCWGHGEGLGVGADHDYPEFSAVPLVVHGLGMGVTSLSPGHEHVCARHHTGGIYCWGAAAAGQTGNGTTEETTQWWPCKVEGL